MLVVDDSILGRYSSIYGRYLTNRIPIESYEAFSKRYEVSSETYFPNPNQKYFTKRGRRRMSNSAVRHRLDLYQRSPTLRVFMFTLGLRLSVYLCSHS